MIIKELTSSRLLLRPFRQTDLDAFYAYCQNPNVGPNAGWKPHTSKRESAAILKNFIEGGEIWAIESQTTGALMGSIGLHEDHKRQNDRARMLGYVLAEPYWGKGYMTEAAQRLIRYAFEETETELISVYHYPFNQRSRRVIKKCGFQYEGTLRCASRLFDGSMHDDVCYSLTKREYVARSR